MDRAHRLPTLPFGVADRVEVAGIGHDDRWDRLVETFSPGDQSEPQSTIDLPDETVSLLKGYIVALFYDGTGDAPGGDTGAQ